VCRDGSGGSQANTEGAEKEVPTLTVSEEEKGSDGGERIGVGRGVQEVPSTP